MARTKTSAAIPVPRQSTAAHEALPAPGPLYERVKRYIVDRIASGDWGEDDRVPSEHELVREFGVSRMTVHRALRELTAEGVLIRIQGVGTFVAPPKPLLALLEIRNIADEIRGRGHLHVAQVHLLRRERAGQELARALELPAGAEVFHSILVHRENGLPVQVEDRYVNPAAAPGYLEQDFTRITPNEYLMSAAPLDEVEHVIEAIMPDRRVRRLLEIGPDEPCLLLHRRTWSRGAVAARTRLLHPGSRYRLGGRFTHRGSEAPAAAAGPHRQPTTGDV